MAATRGLAFATPVGMVNRIHRHAAYRRPLSQPAGPACLAEAHIRMIQIPNLTDGRLAFDVNLAHFTRRHFHLGVVAFLGHELSSAPRRASQLCAPRPLRISIL